MHILSAPSASIATLESHLRIKPTPKTWIKSVAADGSSVASTAARRQRQRTTPKVLSAFEARLSLVIALASQTSSLSQRLVRELAEETAKYLFPSSRFESQTLEESLMSVPDLESVKFKVLRRNDRYEIREVESYFVAETAMPGKYGFDFNGSSRSFNVLAEYLFGKNTKKESMEMTTPVFTSKTQPEGVKMEMTTPVITKKYGSDLPLPKDPAVTIKEVPRKLVAVVAFSGFVSDEEVKRRESALRDSLERDGEYRVKRGASVEVAQYNPPFSLPFTRRNEIILEVERKYK